MKPLTAKEVARILKDHGYVLDHYTGSHGIWIKLENGHSVSIPRHGNKALKQGTLIAIFNACHIPKPRR